MNCDNCKEEMGHYPEWELEFVHDDEGMHKTQWLLCSEICLLQLAEHLNYDRYQVK